MGSVNDLLSTVLSLSVIVIAVWMAGLSCAFFSLESYIKSIKVQQIQFVTVRKPVTREIRYVVMPDESRESDFGTVAHARYRWNAAEQGVHSIYAIKCARRCTFGGRKI